MNFIMGASSSKIEEDKALLLCRERRRFVRQALDGRCSLADAHVSYVEALRNTGVALGRFFEPDAPVESSLYSSISATPEPLVLTEKSASQFSVSSRSPSRHVEILESYSPIPSPVGPQVNVNHMKSGRNNSTTIEERPPISVTAAVLSSDISPKASPLLNDTSTYDGSIMDSETPPWDYFGFFHPIDSQFSYGDDKILSHGSENVGDIGQLREADNIPQLKIDDVRHISKAKGIPRLEGDDIRRLREAEGIPELEEEGDKSSANGKSDFVESEDDFDQPSSEPLVRIFKNRTEEMNLDSMDGSLDALPANNHPEGRNESEANTRPIKAANENGTMSNSMVVRAAATVSPAPINGTYESEKEIDSDNKVTVKDFVSSIKEIKELFIKASESGKQVPRMLEANKVNFRPRYAEGKAGKSSGSMFFMVLRCCREETHIHEETTMTDIKYLTWHRSVSSISSSSQNLFGTAEEGGGGLFSSSCMNSGSHASTLDRLYAWEKKLYDEVKASGIVRKEYDIKCKLLRQQESRCENSNKTDEIRAKVKDSYSRVKVAIQRINSISRIIEELRDKELQPQLEELIEGLSHMWEAMQECHRRQVNVISVAISSRGVRISRRSESHSQAAAVVLEHELNFLCTSFIRWIHAQKSYLRAINEWLLKCAPLPPAVKRRSSKKMKDEFCPVKSGGPPIYATCRDWLKGLDKLPSNEVADAVKSLADETARFLPRQEKKKRHGGGGGAFGRNGEVMQEMMLDKRGAELSDRNPAGIEGVQSRLHVFLNGLQTFSTKSVEMYADLGESIRNVKAQYELGRWKMMS